MALGSQPPPSSFLVCLDPGHGGSDSGAAYNGVQEKDVNLDIALRARSLLQQMGYRIIMTRDSDVYVSLADRCNIANNAHASIFVAIHNNAYLTTSTGTETYCYYNSTEGRKLATCIQQQVVSHLGRTDRGVKEAGFYVLRHTNMTAALVEGLFLTNPEEAKLLLQPVTRQEIAAGVAAGVEEYLSGVVSNQGPSIELRDPADGSLVSGKTSVVANFTNVSGTSIKRVRLSCDGAIVQDKIISPATRTLSYEYAWDTSTISLGRHKLMLQVWDTDNKTASATAQIYVVNSDQVKSRFYFAEGTTRANVVEYLCIENPGSKNAKAVITYMLDTGQNINKEYVIPAHYRFTIDVGSDVGAGHDVAALLQSDQSVVAERPMYFNYHGAWTGGHDVVGATSPASIFYFAEGSCRPSFDPYLCIQNPGRATAKVRITYMKGDGKTRTQSLTVAKNSRATVNIKDRLGQGDDPSHDFSAKVECINGQKIIAERAMYFNYQGSTQLNWTGGHDVVGATAPSRTFYFAEGTTRPDFDSYLCIQNPGYSDAMVHITYMKGDNTVQTQDLTVAKNSRSTVRVKDKLGAGNDFSHDFSAKVECTNGQGIVAERPMYFNFDGVWTGGHDVVGATSPSSIFHFAEGSTRPGFDSFLCIQNPGSFDADVRVTYMKGNGTMTAQSVRVPAYSRSTIHPADVLGEGDDATHDFSAKVECINGQKIIAERPMYFNYKGVWTGGSDVMGHTL